MKISNLRASLPGISIILESFKAGLPYSACKFIHEQAQRLKKEAVALGLSQNAQDIIQSSFKATIETIHRVAAPQTETVKKWQSHCAEKYLHNVHEVHMFNESEASVSQRFSSISKELIRLQVFQASVVYRERKEFGNDAFQAYVLNHLPGELPNYVALISPAFAEKEAPELWAMYHTTAHLYENNTGREMKTAWLSLLESHTRKSAHTDLRLPTDMTP